MAEHIDPPFTTHLPGSPGPSPAGYMKKDAGSGWLTFTVKGIKGPSAPGLYWVLIGAALGAFAGPPGIFAGFFIPLCYIIGRSGSTGKFARHRAPGGSFDASTLGIRWSNGARVATNDITRLVCRNVLDGQVLSTTVVGGSGFVAGTSAIGANRHLADFNAFLPIAWQVEIETGGRTIPLVGSMTSATADALFRDLAGLLGFRS